MSKYKISNFNGYGFTIHMEEDQFLAFVREYGLPIFIDKRGDKHSWYNGLFIHIEKHQQDAFAAFRDEN